MCCARNSIIDFCKSCFHALEYYNIELINLITFGRNCIILQLVINACCENRDLTLA